MKVLLHAPTPSALVRARANAISLRQTDEEAAVVIIANGGAVSAALAHPDPRTDGWLVLPYELNGLSAADILKYKPFLAPILAAIEA